MRRDAVLDRYVAELAATLPGPARARASLVAEARDGLVDAAEAYREAGYPTAEAERMAVADFGPVRRIAGDYRAELALSQGRRTLVLTVALQLLVHLSSEVGWRVGRTQLWGDAEPGWGYRVVARVVDVSQVVPMVLAVLAVVFAFTYGQRWLGRPDLLVRAAGWFAAVVAATMLTSCVLMSSLTPGLSAALPLAVSVLSVGVPAALIVLSARRCLAASRPPVVA